MNNNKTKNRPPVLYASLDDFMPIIEQSISEGKSVEISPRGVSMLPLIREGKDTVVLFPVTAPLKKYDIPLYRRSDGKYILHRVVQIKNGQYTMSGDNQFAYENGIRHEQVIAVVRTIKRNGRPLSARSPMCMIYAFLLDTTRPIRQLALRAVGKIKRTFKK